MNVCSPCGLDFASVSAFDEHRIGEHDYTYSEGLKMNPVRYDGRRCLTADELMAMGWRTDSHGRWRKPAGAFVAQRRS